MPPARPNKRSREARHFCSLSECGLREDTEWRRKRAYRMVLRAFMEATMVRKLVLIILASAALALVLASVCHLFLPDVLPYAAGEGERASWRREGPAMAVGAAAAAAGISGPV